MITTGVLSLSLLLSAAVLRGSLASVELRARSISGEDAVLRCPAEAQPGVRYCSVIWYKVSEAPSRKLSGLVMKNLTQSNGTVQRYKGFVREVQILEDSQSLLLPNVTQEDSGRYLCFLSAPVGHQNQEKEIHLAVYDHADEENMRKETSEGKYEHENDTVFMVLAITLLIVAMLMLYCSYICLRNTLTRHKEKFSKNALLKKTQHEMKHVIVSLKPNGIVSKILPEQQYV
ncbi:CD83 antigen [Astyanax mexicanus]|uniref:Ig-like domain-containing protein n=1 Tax=Astyanax mexicanus TaxID=7994 RepID=A0A8B9K6Y8_ASTMX|nr:CD83 antigen [Astyanax mexicanus]KAG9276130.1 hypothetical protein AMEX_G8410 [Astyanax mexicanus]